MCGRQQLLVEDIEIMRNEFVAVVESLDGDTIAWCPEIPEARGKGRTKIAALADLQYVVSQILAQRRDEAIQRAPEGAVIETICID